MLIDFRHGGRKGEHDRERNMDVRNIYWLCLAYAPTGDRTCNLGMCPNWGINPWPFGLWDSAPAS